MAAERQKSKKEIDVFKHKDKRKNIPTEELRDFIKEDERNPKTILYPRDTSLDPQLVWKGKDEQDSKPLEVPSVPIYIQEKIHPQAIIDDLKRQAKKEIPDQTSLFADFNGINFEQMVDFYHHEQNWANRMILGDSLMVMTSLAEKEGLKGRVQMIYVDPPYGINFSSNWQVSTRKKVVKDLVDDVCRQPEQVTAYRDTWALGINSYLSYLRDRLIAARDLLTDTGAIFIQMNSENSHVVACLLDEVFGPENFIANIIFRKKSLPLGAKFLETMHDHILFYAKNKENLKYKNLYELNDVSQISSHGPYMILPYGKCEKIRIEEFNSPSHTEGTKYFRLFSLIAPSYSSNTDFPYPFKGLVYPPPSKGSWVVDKQKLKRISYADRLQVEGKSLSYRLFYNDFPFKKMTNFWLETAMSYEKIYVVQTTPTIIERCLLMTTDPGDLVLDPTCGSGTTAYVAEQWGRRWITVDTSRVALALARTRLMAARYPYYFLADSAEGVKKQAEVTGKIPPEYKTAKDIKKGFVYKQVPHITLKSIANNPEIDAIHEKWQPKQEQILKELNKSVKEKWQEWEVPFEADNKWSAEAKKLHKKWLETKQARQKEIDDSIARNADHELLYDQPYEDNKRVRVTGPFTVESLSPHRVLSTSEERPASEKEAKKESINGQFELMIFENLKSAGVQNTKKNERLKFDSLEPHAGTWIHAAGMYSESGKTKRVAVSIGPEHGTVGPELVKEAAKEAVQGVGYDLLIICGFAFDPHVSEEVKRYGTLTILPARMNPDLSMGDELLKKTGAGNLFMVFGEPDIDIKKKGDTYTVELKGVDVYDPTTGEIRPNSTDDVMCWFIDTDYNGESFFVRQAYFTGNDKPFEKLQRTLQAEINPDAWETIYSTVSRPFEKPDTGKIAIKVINHYGDEVLKVFVLNE